MCLEYIGLVCYCQSCLKEAGRGAWFRRLRKRFNLRVVEKTRVATKRDCKRGRNGPIQNERHIGCWTPISPHDTLPKQRMDLFQPFEDTKAAPGRPEVWTTCMRGLPGVNCGDFPDSGTPFSDLSDSCKLDAFGEKSRRKLGWRSSRKLLGVVCMAPSFLDFRLCPLGLKRAVEIDPTSERNPFRVSLLGHTLNPCTQGL